MRANIEIKHDAARQFFQVEIATPAFGNDADHVYRSTVFDYSEDGWYDTANEAFDAADEWANGAAAMARALSAGSIGRVEGTLHMKLAAKKIDDEKAKA